MELPISLSTYAVLLGHLRHFPAERHAEVLRRLDFEPGEWPGYAERGERALLARMEAGEDTSDFTKVLGETKRELKKKSPAVEELPLNQGSAAAEEGSPRTMRLRDLDPVEFLNVVSSRMETSVAAEAVGEGNVPVVGPVIPGVDVRPAPRADAAPIPNAMPMRAVPPMPVQPSPVVRETEPALSPAEAARQRTRAAKAMFESTKVSPTSERMTSDGSPRIDVTVKESASSPFAASTPVEEPVPAPPPENELSPATQMIQPEEAVFPGVQLPTLSIFEFATLCAEFNVCGEANKAQVRNKYGIPTESERLALLDAWRIRLVQNPNELAEWKQQFDAATRHWQQIYKR